MTPIAAKELVRAPLASAASLLAAFLAAHPAPKGEGARVVLHAGDFEEPAIVSVKPAHKPGDMTPRYAIHWEAEGTGPYPQFDGELTIGADEDYNAFWFILDGAYVPPGGVAGKLFDAAIGHRIAEATAQGLLREMRTEIEAHFEAQERAKRERPERISAP
jgi:hypothetical protein